MTDKEIRKAIYTVHQRIWDGVIEEIRRQHYWSIGLIKRVVWDRIKDDYNPLKFFNICIGCTFANNRYECTTCFLKLLSCDNVESIFMLLSRSLKRKQIANAIFYAKMMRNCGYYDDRGDIDKMKKFLKLC